MTEGITFEVETRRILEILSKDIYDSPMALLRENVQNAYDAILMRASSEGRPISMGRIDIQIDHATLVIQDNGIGMTEEVLRENFWKAGSSGKRTELAKASGVIGTFGIGAMANFGVASGLTVETRSIDSDETLISIAHRDTLSIAQECIELQRVHDGRGPGTKVTASLDDPFTPPQARSYLEQYVQFLPVPVYINGDLVSQQSLEDRVMADRSAYKSLGELRVQSGMYSANVVISISSNGNASATMQEIQLGSESVSGQLVLVQRRGQLMGLRNFFGLAPIPVSGFYQMGGAANLSILHPTAGREALSRESIQHVAQLVSLAEHAITQKIAETEAADRNSDFMNYILKNEKIDLARNIKVEVLPDEAAVPLGDLTSFCAGRTVLYYVGSDKSITQTFATASSCLVRISQALPRRKLQVRYVREIVGISEVPDKATVIKEFVGTELSIAEAALVVRVASTLSDDYFLNNVEVRLAEISYGVEFLVRQIDETVVIYVARDSAPVRPMLECYQTAPDVFSSFIKDFVRVHLYQRVSQYVPSSTREGADALCDLLRRNRELYRYEESELGELEPLLADYLSGDATLGEVLKKVRSTARPQSQRVRSDQVGQVEKAFPDVIESPAPPGTEGREFDAAPAIIRDEVICDLKILTTENKYGQLNGFELFLGLSDRLFKREREFFRAPHTTKIIWGGHRIIYIFGHASGAITLYYDIELREPLSEHRASGSMVPSTTLITKNRIYVPVPSELVDEFKISEGAKEFFVRFDTVP